MSELTPIPSDDEAAPYWNRKRIGLAALAVFLVVLLIAAVLLALLVAFGPTICCGMFPNIVNSL